MLHILIRLEQVAIGARIVSQDGERFCATLAYRDMRSESLQELSLRFILGHGSPSASLYVLSHSPRENSILKNGDCSLSYHWRQRNIKYVLTLGPSSSIDHTFAAC